MALFCMFSVRACFRVPAQSCATGVSGTVRDKQGCVIAGITLTLTDADRGMSRTQSTDSSYSFSNFVIEATT